MSGGEDGNNNDRVLLDAPVYEAFTSTLKEGFNRSDHGEPMSIDSFFKRIEQLTNRKLGKRLRDKLLNGLIKEDCIGERVNGKVMRLRPLSEY